MIKKMIKMKKTSLINNPLKKFRQTLTIKRNPINLKNSLENYNKFEISADIENNKYYKPKLINRETAKWYRNVCFGIQYIPVIAYLIINYFVQRYNIANK